MTSDESEAGGPDILINTTKVEVITLYITQSGRNDKKYLRRKMHVKK